MIPKQLRIYYWLVKTLRESKGMTLEEINEQWFKDEMSDDGRPLSRRTFYRYRNEVEGLFGLDIATDPHDGYKYHIKNISILEDEGLHQWMMSTLAVRQHLEDDMRLADRILIEPIPSGDIWLDSIVEAMKENRKLNVLYKRYESHTAKNWRLAPYCVKVYNRRWFMLGMTEYGKLLTFALDRMIDVDLTDEQFEMEEGFDAKDYYNGMYGVYRDEDAEMQRIVIRTYDSEHHYLRDLPLHSSQREVARGDDYVDFELVLYPNKELSAYIMSRGKRMEVIYPEWYAREVQEMKAV